MWEVADSSVRARIQKGLDLADRAWPMETREITTRDPAQQLMVDQEVARLYSKDEERPPGDRGGFKSLPGGVTGGPQKGNCRLLLGPDGLFVWRCVNHPSEATLWRFMK